MLPILSPEELLALPDAKLQAALWELERERCKDDLYYLATAILGYNDLTESLHRPLCYVVASINTIIQAQASRKSIQPHELEHQAHLDEWASKYPDNPVNRAGNIDSGGGGGGSATESPPTKLNKISLSNFSFYLPVNFNNNFKKFDRWLTWDAGSKTRLFLLFRSAFKSTIITTAHAIQLMLIWPDIRILIASHKKEGGSQKFLGQIKDHFIRNERFRKLFPEFCPKPNGAGVIDWGTADQVTLPNRSKLAIFPEASIEVAGLTTDVTGRHYDYIIADDMVTRDSVTNETMLSKTEEYNSLLKFLFNQPEWGIMDYVGTPYHFADLYATLRDQKDITKVIVPIIDENGDLTFPERFTKEGVEKIKNDPGQTSYTFSCQYLLNPVPTEDQVFRPESFKRPGFYYSELPERLNHYIFVDPANKQRKSSDYTALMHIGFDQDNHVYVIDMIRDKLADADRVKLVMEYAKKAGLHRVYYESIGFQSTDAYNIRRYSVEQGYHLSVEEIKASKSSKEDRIRGLQYLFESGGIHFPRRYDYYSKYDKRTLEMVEIFRKEAFMFPKCEHDDMLDCLSFCLAINTHSASSQVTTESMNEFDRLRQLVIDQKKPKVAVAKYPRRKSGFYELPAKRSFR